MQRIILPVLTLVSCLSACEPQTATITPDAATSQDAEVSDEGDASSEKATPKAEDNSKAAELKMAFAKLETAKTEDSARWTDSLRADAHKMLAVSHSDAATALKAIVAGPHRHPENVARDDQRHPEQTLAFFSIRPDMTVVEIGPGRGWYTEILAPFLAKSGQLVVNSSDPNGPETESRTYYARRFQYFVDSNQELYGKIVQQRGKDGVLNIGAEASADAVLVVRGLHGHARRGTLAATLETIHATLKEGGIFGVVQHRAAEGADPKISAKAGYLPQAWLVEQVLAAGFVLQESSEINANPKDTRDYPEGVWTLPPTLALGEKDAATYKTIGESDRMTLRFAKR